MTTPDQELTSIRVTLDTVLIPELDKLKQRLLRLGPMNADSCRSVVRSLGKLQRRTKKLRREALRNVKDGITFGEEMERIKSTTRDPPFGRGYPVYIDGRLIAFLGDTGSRRSPDWKLIYILTPSGKYGVGSWATPLDTANTLEEAQRETRDRFSSELLKRMFGKKAKEKCES